MERLWTKSFIIMSVGTLFLFNAFYMLYPTLPLFIKQIGGNEAFVENKTATHFNCRVKEQDRANCIRRFIYGSY
jgi:hypothetical protein